MPSPIASMVISGAICGTLLASDAVILIAQSGGIEISAGWVFAFIAGSGGVIAFLFRLLISSKDATIASMEKAAQLALEASKREVDEQKSMKVSYQDIAQEATKSMLETTNYYRAKDGKPPVLIVAPVVPESHSPSTMLQREVAGIASLRAIMAATKEATGQEPRPIPPHAVEIGGDAVEKAAIMVMKDATTHEVELGETS